MSTWALFVSGAIARHRCFTEAEESVNPVAAAEGSTATDGSETKPSRATYWVGGKVVLVVFASKSKAVHPLRMQFDWHSGALICKVCNMQEGSLLN